MQTEPAQPSARRVAIVVNPTKFDDVASVRARATEVCRRHGWADPLWLETTAEDTGTGQTRQALEEGVDLICPLGGDGTVREVGAALVGTGTPMGLLPGGTGNLLARNLGLPFDSLERALTVALTGQDKAIDTCRLRLVRPTSAQLEARLEDEDDEARNVDLDDAVDDPGDGDKVEEHTFLVMAGLGFDAEVMASVPEDLKKRVGWLAYLVGGLRHLYGPKFRAQLSLADGTRVRRRVRTVMVGNVGELQGGMRLLPGAAADDGAVHAVVMSPRGMIGWIGVVGNIVTQGRTGHALVERYSSPGIRVQASKPIEIEMDGDTLGNAVAMDVQVRPSSLTVRVGQG